ncbi:MAG: tape measure protein [Clostridia bacterium]|nr:tape measure protein [Clostridia bacterium]
MAESFSVKAILSAKDSGFSSTLKSASSTLESLGSKLKSGLGFGILTGIGQQAFSTLTNGARELIGEINSSNKAWKTFEGNMKILGKTEKDINSVKKTLQDYATTTIYSSSDMASSYAQLAAVGIKSADKLVTGFGGLAGAAENPAQAMKTLSQQGVQMAAKPKVAWQDFKLMLEQTPAGIAAVAKEMGMSTSEMVTAVQDGKIKTQDFFDAVQKVGNSDGFTKLATEYKSVDQAMDGLQETMGNKLMPAFDALSQYGIKAISGIIDKLGGLDGQAIADKLTGWIDTALKYWDALVDSFSGVGTELKGAFDAIVGGIQSVTGTLDGSGSSLESFKSTMTSVADGIKAVANFLEEHGEAIGKALPYVVALVGAYKGFSIVSSVVPGVMAFTKGIAGLAGKGIGGIAAKLFGISTSQQTVGTTSATSGAQMLNAAKSYALMGVAVLTIAAGFALLAQSAIALANAGGLAIGVMAGLVVGVAGLGVGMALLLKSLAPMSGQLMPVATAFLAMGAAVVLIAAGFAILAVSSIALANAGGAAIGVMVGMVAAIALLAVGAAALGTAMTAGAVGFLAFGAAVLMVGAGFALIGVSALLVASALTMIVALLPQLTTYGTSGATAATALGAGLVALGAGAVAASAGLIALDVAIVAFGISMAASAVGVLAMKVALKGVNSSMKTIAKNAKSTEKSLDGMQNSVNAVESGLSALGDKAKSAMNSLKNAFDDTARNAESAGKKTGTGFATGIQSGMVMAVAAATTGSSQVNTVLNSGYAGAFAAGAYISIGFANGMRSQLGAIRSAAAQMAAAADAAVRAKAKIHSPSKVADSLGAYWGEGYIEGLESMLSKAWRIAEEFVAIPQVATPVLAGGFSGELSSDYDYSNNASFRIEVPLNIDGREFAKAEADYMQEELNRKELRANRKLGRV